MEKRYSILTCRTIDVSAPRSPFTIPCASRSAQMNEFSGRYHLFVANHKLPVHIRLIVELLYCFGLRISEVLRIRGTDILPNGLIHIKGLKNSNDRIVSSSMFSSYIFEFINIPILLFPSVDRFYIYRLLRRVGLGLSTDDFHKQRVTHSFRSNFINQLFENTHNIDTVAQLVGHKNANNSIIYLNANNKKIEKRERNLRICKD